MKVYSCCLSNANMSKAELSGALIDNEAIKLDVVEFIIPKD